jgi:hypothetical protein
LFTLSAAGRTTDAQDVHRTTKKALSSIEADRGPDWPIVLSFSASRVPATLPAVFASCPDDRAVRGFVSGSLRGIDEVVSVVERLLSMGEEGQAQRILYIALDNRKTDSVRAFIRLFDALSSKVEPFAKSVFLDAFRYATSQEPPFSPTMDEWEWFAGKKDSDFVPDSARDDYWSAVDAMLPPDANCNQRFHPVLDSFLLSRPVLQGCTKAEFHRWLEDLLKNSKAPFSFPDLEQYAPVFSGFDADDRRKCMVRLLPVLYSKISNTAEKGLAPTSVNQHRKLIHFFADGLENRERASVAELYVEHAVEDARKQRDRMQSVRFCSLLRLVLRPDTDMVLGSTIRKALLRRVYLKYSRKEMEDVKFLPALTCLSIGEGNGWEAFFQEYTTLKRNRRVVIRIWHLLLDAMRQLKNLLLDAISQLKK